MAKNLETDIRHDRKKIVWRSQGGFYNKSTSLVLPITRVVPSHTYFATQDYEPRNILNLDELGLFFKVLLENKLMEKGKKGGKKSKQRMAVIIIVASNRSFVFEPTLIWRSKGPRCFKSLCTFVPVKILGWTQTLWRVFCRDLTVKCAKKSSRLSYFGFWDNATCHPETLQARLTNIKIVFLPKNTTSGLQFLNASIIRSFKHKYRKLLVCHVVSRIDEHVY